MFCYVTILRSDEKPIEIKEILINHYMNLMIKGRESQNFLIKNLIKSLDEKIIKEKFEEGDEINILVKDNNYDKPEWVIQKIDYFSNVISPTPKIPYELYKFSVSKDIPKYGKLLHFKKKSFSFKSEGVESYGNIIRINEMGKKEDFRIAIEYLLIGIEGFEKIKDLREENEIFIRVLFLHDRAPLNSYERKIKVFGIMEGIK